MSFSSSSLSTTALCWKNNIHGAMVVPMLAIINVRRPAVRPAGKLGETMLRVTSLQLGFARKAAGMYTRLRRQKTSVILSKVQYVPEATSTVRKMTDATIVNRGGIPKMLAAANMPMNSVLLGG